MHAMRPCPETVDFERQGTPIGPVINARKQRGAERTMETGEGGETGRGRKEARTHVRKEGRKEGEEGRKEGSEGAARVQLVSDVCGGRMA